MNKKDILGLKYFIGLSAIVVSIYTYAMVTGWRFWSYGEYTNEKNSTTGHRTGRAHYYHK